LPRDYEVFVGLPDGYAASGARRYPVLFVADANYAFPLLRSITRRVGASGKGLEDFILVGLSYAKGDTPKQSRGRDYTPSAGGPKDFEGPQRPDYGQAEAYRRFLAEEVLPLIGRTYRADMSRKTLAGHSYGALLGAHILLTEPTMFERYALSSPSLWFDHGLMFRREAEYAASHKDLPAKLLLSAGQFEALKRGDPRYNDDQDMVADMRRFERLLKSRRYPGLQIESQVFAGEDHLTVNPVSLTRALKWAFGPRPKPTP
jgi:predicted alpha/beta superfamily hydrolase